MKGEIFQAWLKTTRPHYDEKGWDLHLVRVTLLGRA